MKRKLPAINIQWPISQLIASGEKTIETRTYELPEKYIGNPLFFVETPGKTGNFKARVIGEIIFSKSKRYRSREEFYKDQKRHHVSKDSVWKWDKKEKWGWEIEKLTLYKCSYPAPGGRGIVFTKEILLNL